MCLGDDNGGAVCGLLLVCSDVDGPWFGEVEGRVSV